MRVGGGGERLRGSGRVGEWAFCSAAGGARLAQEGGATGGAGRRGAACGEWASALVCEVVV
jgi:hypothetical protein